MRNPLRQRQWTKAHYRNIKGYRVKYPVRLPVPGVTGNIEITPDDFLHGNIEREPLNIYGMNVSVYVPRALCVRARITVDKTTGDIKGTSKMYTANK